jgi:CelD/BcsL family acetyltransferase involved in cellulose biosynthesis
VGRWEAQVSTEIGHAEGLEDKPRQGSAGGRVNLVGNGLRIKELRNYPEFTALREPWNELADAGQVKSVFLRHEWFDAVWQWPQGTFRPLILAFYEDRKLVGILPLAWQRPRIPGLGLRRLAPLQTPDTQEFDLITEPGQTNRVAQAFAHWLRRRRQGWDLLHLSGFPQGTGSPAAIAAALDQFGIPSEPGPDQVNLKVNLDCPWEDYYRGLSRRLKKNNNLNRNRLEKAASVDVRRYEEALPGSEALAQAKVISARSWKSELGVTLNHPGPGAFIDRLSQHASRNGWLSLWLLLLDGQAAAMEYQLVFGGQVHALRADFDPAWQELSPGGYLHHQQLRALFDQEGVTTYLMGPGSNPYKLRWSQQGETLKSLVVWSPSLRGVGVREAYNRLFPKARRLRELVSWRSKGADR